MLKTTGSASPPEHQQRIFAAFERVDETYRGAGFGLTFVRRSVQEMGGRVGVELQPGRGSRIRIGLPRTQ